MKKSVILAAFAAVSLATGSSHAAIAASWSASGGAWTAANQPNFSSSVGTIYNDQSIAAGTNNATDNALPTLTVTGAAPPTGGGIYGDYYYSLFATPTLTVSATTDSPLQVLSLTMFSSAVTSLEFVTLTIGGTTYTASSFTNEAGGGGMESDIPSVWTWDLSGANIAAGTNLSLSFTLANHNAVEGISLSQIPEPSAALLGVLGATGFFLRRRR